MRAEAERLVLAVGASRAACDRDDERARDVVGAVAGRAVRDVEARVLNDARVVGQATRWSRPAGACAGGMRV